MPVDRSQTTPIGAVQPPSVLGSRSVLAGVVLLVIGAGGFWQAGELSTGTLDAPGPGLAPQAFGLLVALCGIVLVARGVFAERVAVEWPAFGPPAWVLAAIVVFALTIRPFDFGPVTTPGLGLAIAGPLTVLIAGAASSVVGLISRIVSALSLTAFSIALFSDVLGLPIPIYPAALDGMLADLSGQSLSRIIAGSCALAALVLIVLRRMRSRAA